MRRIKLRRVLSVFLGLLLVLALVVAGLTMTSPGLSLVAGLTGRIVSSPGKIIQINGLSGIWSGKLKVDQVSLSDTKGPWLNLKGVNLDWSPFALIGGTFRAEKLQINSVQALRPPIEEKLAETSADGGSASLPVDIVLKALAIDKIDISEKFGGDAETITLSGLVEVLRDENKARLKLDVALQGSGGTISINSAFDAGKDLLQLQARAALPKNNILVRMANIKSLPSVSLVVDGKGPLKQWQGRLELAFDDKLIVEGLATVAAEGPNLRIKGRMNGKLAQIMPSGVAALFAGESRIEWDISRTAEGAIDILAARSSSYTSQIEVSGRILPGSWIKGLIVEMQTGGPDGIGYDIGGAILGPFSLKLSADGEWSSARIGLNGQISYLDTDQVQLQALTLAGQGSGVDIQAPAAGFSLTGSIKSVVSSDASLQPLLKGAVRLASKGRYENGQLNFGEFLLQNKVAGLSLTGGVILATGAFNIASNGAVRVGKGAHPLAFLGQGESSLKVRLSRSLNDGWKFSDVRLVAPSASLNGNGSFGDAGINAEFTGSLAELNTLSSDFNGSVVFTGKMSGAASAPLFSINMEGDNIKVQGQAISGLSANISGTASPTAPSASVRLDGQYRGQPLVLRGTLKTADQGGRRIDGIDIRIANAALNGNLTLNRNMMPDGSIKLAVPDLTVLAPFIGQQDLAGKLSGTIVFASNAKTFDTRVKMNAAGLKVASASIASAAMDVGIADVLGQLAVQGRITSPNIVVSGTKISNLDLKAVKDGAATNFQATAKIDKDPFAVNGRLEPRNKGGMNILLQQLAAAYQGIKVRLAAPSRVTIDQGMVTIAKTRINLGGGNVILAGRAGKSLDIKINLAGVNLALVNRFAPGIGLSGSASGTVALTGRSDNPTVPFNLKLTKISAAAMKQAGVPTLNIAASGRYANKTVNLKSTRITGSGLDLGLAGTINTKAPVVLGLKLKGKVPFTLIEKQLTASGIRLTGGSTIDLAIKGNAANPAITGAINATGTFVETASKLTINNLKANAVLAPGNIELRSLTGNFAKGGSLSAKGTIGIKPGSGFPANIDIGLNSAIYDDGEIVSAKMSGKINVGGKLAVQPKISGLINVAEANITIPQSLGGSAAALGLKHKNASKKVNAQNAEINPKKKKSSSGGGGAGLDLTVSAPRRIFVRGRGLDAELGGKIKLDGTTANPRATGGFKLINGKLDILTRRVDFDYGTIGFSGALDPDLDFRASSKVSDATVSINVNGRASNPKISFSSQPQLPEDEVVARFIFGESLQNLSVIQVAQLASAISTLSGKGGEGLVEKLRKSTGIDNLDVTNDAKNGVTVTAEKYITDKLKVGVQKGAKSGSGKVIIDFDILKNLKARGVLGQEGSSKGGLFYEKEY